MQYPNHNTKSSMYPRAKFVLKTRPNNESKKNVNKIIQQPIVQLIHRPINQPTNKNVNFERISNLMQDSNGRRYALSARLERSNIAETSLGQRLQANGSRLMQSALQHIRDILGTARTWCTRW